MISHTLDNFNCPSCTNALLETSTENKEMTFDDSAIFSSSEFKYAFMSLIGA